MARTGVTFEQVSAVADALAGEGKTPSMGSSQNSDNKAR